jgi:hypothetical protein
MRHTRSVVWAAAVGLIVALEAVPAGAAIMGPQVDNFEGGTLQNWQNGGASNPNPATNITTGGPAGAADNFMRLSSNGLGSGGKLVVFNIDQWAGNFLTAGVNAVQMDVNNLGQTNLTLRLILVDSTAGQSLTTSAPVNVPAGSGWIQVSFSLAPANLQGGNYNTVMDSVTEFNLVHSPNVVSARSLSPNIVAQLGVDNITAVVPEPGMVGLAAVALAAATGRRAGRRVGRRARI